MDSGLVTVLVTFITAVASVVVAVIARGRKERPGMTPALPQDDAATQRDVAALTAAAEGHGHNTATTVTTMARTQVELIDQMSNLWSRLTELEDYRKTADARFVQARKNGSAWRRRAIFLGEWGRITEEPVPRTIPAWASAEDLEAATRPFGDDPASAGQ